MPVRADYARRTMRARSLSTNRQSHSPFRPFGKPLASPRARYARLTRVSGLVLVVVLVGLAMLLGGTASASPSLDPPARLAPVSGVGKVRWGYYVPYHPSSRASLEAHVGDLDVVSPTWYRLEADGSVVESYKDDHAAITRIVRQRGARLIPLVVNGPRNAAFHAFAADTSLRRGGVANLLGLVQREGFDGIHIDFEGLDGADRPLLTAFMKELSAAFRAQGKWVTQAVPAREKELNVGWAGAFDYAALGRANDLIVLMAYGFRTASSTTPGPPADLPWVSRTLSFASGLIPAQKLLLGVPLYGYDWNTASGPPARALHYSELADLVRARGVTPGYDEASQTATLSYSDGGQRHEVWYEDARSLAAKLDLVEQYSLAGAAAWRLGHEDPQAWEAFGARLGYRHWYLAEGATAPPFETWLLLFNPNAEPAQATITLRSDSSTSSGQAEVRHMEQIPPGSRASVFVNRLMPNAAFSAEVTADRAIAVERAMYFNQDGHASAAATSPSRTWYLPEGFTSGDVDTWLLLYNPNQTPARATVTFLRESGPPVTTSVSVPGRSRHSLRTNGLVTGAFSTQVTSDQPIVAERSTYFDRFGHGSMGSAILASRWHFADAGTTDDTWILLLNPQSDAVNATFSFVDERGVETKRSIGLRPRSRTTVHVNDPSLRPGSGQALVPRGGAYALTVDASAPIAAERAVYTAEGGGASALGAPAPSLRWLLPEGSTASPFREEIAIYNPGGTQANVALSLASNGTSTPLSVVVAPRSRRTVDLSASAPGRHLAVRVVSDTGVVIERRMSWNRGLTVQAGIPE